MEKEGRVSVFRAIFRKSFTRALWLYHAGTGGCNGCDIEVLDVLTPFYDVERLGMKLVGSPRHADVILVIGPVSRQAAPALRRLYESVPDPKVVVAIGACAIGGGIWFDSYANWGGVDKIIPVDYYIPGCPPHPDWMAGTIAHVLLYGLPKLDDLGRPVLFYGTPVHDHCPYRSYFDEETFCKYFGDTGCRYELGCKGPYASCDAWKRRWNNGANWCVDNAHCIACVEPNFWDEYAPFYELKE